MRSVSSFGNNSSGLLRRARREKQIPQASRQGRDKFRPELQLPDGSGGSRAVAGAVPQLRVRSNLLFREQLGSRQVRAKVNPAQLPAERGDVKGLFAQFGFGPVRAEHPLEFPLGLQNLLAAGQCLLFHLGEKLLNGGGLIGSELEFVLQVEDVPRARVAVELRGESHAKALTALDSLALFIEEGVMARLRRLGRRIRSHVMMLRHLLMHILLRYGGRLLFFLLREEQTQ